MIGQNIKVLLPGERPWVRVLEEVGDTFRGRIINTLFHELSEHEQARFMKRELGEVTSLPQLHSFKRDDEIWFEKGTDESDGWWVPIEKGKIPMAEFEQGYCTGCGYKVRRWGHRPYCWRVVCHQLAHVDPAIRTVVKRCLKKMSKHHRFISLFLCRTKHMYYTVESIDHDEQKSK